MALIQELATPVFKQIISWTNFILVLLIIYKALRLLNTAMGGKLKIPGFGGGGDKDKKEKPDDPTKDIKDIDKNKDNYRKIGLDPDHAGKVLFCAMDSDNNPLIGVKIYVWPLNRNLWTRVTKKQYRNKYFGETGANGFIPEPHFLPAGEWKIKGIKHFWSQKSVFNTNRNIKAGKAKGKNQNFEVAPDSEEDFDKKKPQVKGVIMKRTIEDSFTPLILNYDEYTENNKRYIKLNGIIN